MSVEIVLASGANGFAENKDEARAIRLSQILPALEHGESVALDFGAVRYATQSFVHALGGVAGSGPDGPTSEPRVHVHSRRACC